MFFTGNFRVAFLLQGAQEKFWVFFTIPCNPSLAYIAVQSLLLAGIFLYNQWQPSADEGEVANFREFLEKNTIFNEHPVSTHHPHHPWRQHYILIIDDVGLRLSDEIDNT